MTDQELLDGVGYMYGWGGEENLAHHAVRLVTTRTAHECNSYYHDQRHIPKGSRAVRESGFLDGKPVTCYTCVECATRAYREYQR